MTNYIESLKKELNKKHFSEVEKLDILRDHEEMIKEALADGLEEKDLEKRFGSPEQVVRELEHETEEEQPSSASDVFTPDADHFKVTVGLVNEDFNLHVGSDDQVHVSFSKEKTRDHYEVIFEQNHLIIRKKKSFNLLFSSKSDDQTITLTVPRHIEIHTFKFDVVNGDADIKDISMKDASLNLVNGDVKISNLSIDQLSLHTVGSDITLNQLSLTDGHVSQVSGDLNGYAVYILHDLSISTVSGDVSLEKVTCDQFSINTVSGDVDGKEFYPKSIRYESVSGDVNINNQEKDQIKIVKSSSLSGDISIN